MSEPLVRTPGLRKHYLCRVMRLCMPFPTSPSPRARRIRCHYWPLGFGQVDADELAGALGKAGHRQYALKGREVAKLDRNARAPLRSREIGFVFQMSSLLARSSALENVELPLAYAGVQARATGNAGHRAPWIGSDFRRLEHWPSPALGRRATAGGHRPRHREQTVLILADEPTGALDSKTADGILSLFEDLNRDNRTIVVVTHALDVAEARRRRITSTTDIVGDDASRRPTMSPSAG